MNATPGDILNESFQVHAIIITFVPAAHAAVLNTFLSTTQVGSHDQKAVYRRRERKFKAVNTSGLSNTRRLINSISVFMNRAAGLCVSVFNFTLWGATSVATFIIRSHGV